MTGGFQETYIPRIFEDNLLAHIWSNILYPEHAPLMLVIVGASGTGKTFQVRQFCKRARMHCELASGATFQGSEGQSQRKFVGAYSRAVAGVYGDPPDERPVRQSILLIDDFHLSLASVLSSNFSQNSQIFMASLMSGCDDPRTIFDCRELDAERPPVQFVRVPIIATANSSKEVYPPILRHGRTRVFHWTPTEEDRVQMALVQLARLGRPDIGQVAETYRAEPPVFFRELANRVFERSILALLRGGEMPDKCNVLPHIAGMSIADINRLARDVKESEELRILKFDV